MIAYLGAGFIVLGLLLVMASMSVSYWPPYYPVFALGILVFIMGFILGILDTGNRRQEAIIT